MSDGLHPSVERAALDALKPRIPSAVRAAVDEQTRRILDVVEVLAEQADCMHQREPLNKVLTIFGRGPVEGPTLRTPEHCELEKQG